jgi:hypothetical protein
VYFTLKESQGSLGDGKERGKEGSPKVMLTNNLPLGLNAPGNVRHFHSYPKEGARRLGYLSSDSCYSLMIPDIVGFLCAQIKYTSVARDGCHTKLQGPAVENNEYA